MSHGTDLQARGNTLGSLSYAYDAAGHRSQVGGTWARANLPAAVSTASYNAANQQLTFGPNTMTYDNNGNVATLTDSSGTTTYTWDSRDRLTVLSRPGLTASIGYDGLARRRTKTINGARTDFLYDGLNPVQEKDGAAVVANLLTGLALDAYLTRTDATGARQVLPDALGSVVALTDSTGTVQTEYSYEPFGRTTATGATSTSAFQYTGRENDGTGLYFYRARYYRPELGRFLSEDPIGFGGGDVNLYAYVGNSPASRIDPTGEVWWWLGDFGFYLDLGSVGYDLYRLFTDGRKDLGGNLAALGLDLGGTIIPGITGLGAASRAARGAETATSGLRLKKSLASQQQMREAGQPIAGNGSKRQLRDAERLSQEYGGQPGDWSKMRSSSYRAEDGSQFRTHWYQNHVTGERFEYKTKLGE